MRPITNRGALYSILKERLREEGIRPGSRLDGSDVLFMAPDLESTFEIELPYRLDGRELPDTVASLEKDLMTLLDEKPEDPYIRKGRRLEQHAEGAD